MDRYRNEAMLHCADMYYSTIGLAPNTSRAQDQVRARSALAMALVDYGIQDQVASVIGKDRSTVSHIKRNHPDWLIYWKDYRGLYETASGIARKVLGKQGASEKIKNINERIDFLQSEKEDLEKQLNTQTEL